MSVHKRIIYIYFFVRIESVLPSQGACDLMGPADLTPNRTGMHRYARTEVQTHEHQLEGKARETHFLELAQALEVEFLSQV
jgi:hypothetical protein